MPEVNVDLTVLANGFVLFVAVIGGVGMLWRTLLLPGLVRVIQGELAPIRKEFLVNGGESLKDATNRIERKLEGLEGKVDGHSAWSESVMRHNHLDDPQDRQ